MAYLVYRWYCLRGFSEVMIFYIGPYLVVNMWLVLFTWLHHSHKSVPQYGDR
eukprot:UN21533